MLNLSLREIGAPLSRESAALSPVLSNVIDERQTWHDSSLDLQRGLEVVEHPHVEPAHHVPAATEPLPLVVALKRL